MAIRIAIPDDYQRATASLSFLQGNPAFSCTALGDLTSDPDARSVLARAQGLILIRERTRIDEAFLRKTPELKIISQTGKLARNIDLAACRRAGVVVVEGSGSPVAPAELTWLLIMASRRRLVSSVNAMKAGQWQTELGRAVHRQTLGILGYGKIGRRIAHYGKAFDMQVQVWGSERAREEARREGCLVPEDRETFFATSDVLSVHLRLVKETEAYISEEDLLAMKPDALFVNTSRAELVAPGALLAALRQGRPGFAALDVYEQEPIYDPASPLLQMPNVLCTPHLGYVEQASYESYFQTALDNLMRFFNGNFSPEMNLAAQD